MKPHVVTICVSIFVFCWLILGFRGLDAGIIGPGCFLAGMAVQRKEEAAKEFVDGLKARVTGWFKALKSNP